MTVMLTATVALYGNSVTQFSFYDHTPFLDCRALRAVTMHGCANFPILKSVISNAVKQSSFNILLISSTDTFLLDCYGLKDLQ